MNCQERMMRLRTIIFWFIAVLSLTLGRGAVLSLLTTKVKVIKILFFMCTMIPIVLIIPIVHAGSFPGGMTDFRQIRMSSPSMQHCNFIS